MATWLEYLANHHPDYRYMEISRENIKALPIDGSVHDQLMTREVNEPENNGFNGPPTESIDNPNQEEEIDPIARTAMVPDQLAEDSERQRLQRAGAPVQDTLSVASFRQTPVSEWQNQCLFRMAFPSLFPDGRGDFYLPRERKIRFGSWLQHLLKYKDGRFARHLRFR